MSGNSNEMKISDCKKVRHSKKKFVIDFNFLEANKTTCINIKICFYLSYIHSSNHKYNPII